jgi:hypothetical protein
LSVRDEPGIVPPTPPPQAGRRSHRNITPMERTVARLATKVGGYFRAAQSRHRLRWQGWNCRNPLWLKRSPWSDHAHRLTGIMAVAQDLNLRLVPLIGRLAVTVQERRLPISCPTWDKESGAGESDASSGAARESLLEATRSGRSPGCEPLSSDASGGTTLATFVAQPAG